MSVLVSIMIPCFNQPEYIIQAVESAVCQDYSFKQIIVSDDSENDLTERKLKSFIDSKKIEYKRNIRRIGRVANYRKLLFELAAGEWVIMLDGDDYFVDSSYISKAVKLISTDRTLVLIGGRILQVNSQGMTEADAGLTVTRTIFAGTDVFTAHYLVPHHQTCLYKRTLACSLSFYRHESAGSDSESLFRLCLYGSVGYFMHPCSAWRVHEKNTTFTRDLRLQIKELNFIDSIAIEASRFLTASQVQVWRNKMYNGMATHLVNLAFASRNRLAIIRILWLFGKYFDKRVALSYLKRFFSI